MKRLQRQRTKGWKKPENSMYVGRPSKWGNPYNVWLTDEGWAVIVLEPIPNEPGIYKNHCVFKGEKKACHAKAVSLYKKVLPEIMEKYKLSFADLRGKDLMCYCPLDYPCHADYLLEVANGK